MTILLWLILGIVAGYLAGMLLEGGAYGVTGDIIAGVFGAVVGGWLAWLVLGLDVTGLNVTSVAISAIGAITLIVAVRVISPRRRFPA